MVLKVKRLADMMAEKLAEINEISKTKIDAMKDSANFTPEESAKFFEEKNKLLAERNKMFSEQDEIEKQLIEEVQSFPEGHGDEYGGMFKYCIENSIHFITRY